MRMKYLCGITILILLLMPILSIVSVQAQEPYHITITGTTIWSNLFGAHTYDRIVTVAKSGTLIIDAGTEVDFTTYKTTHGQTLRGYISVEGRLIIRGTENNPVRLNSNIYFRIGSRNDSSINYAIINGTISIANSMTISNSVVHGKGNYVIYIVRDNEPLLLNNTIIGSGEGAGILADHKAGFYEPIESDSLSTVYIVGNTISNFTYGIRTWANAYIENNLLYDNHYAIDINTDSSKIYSFNHINVYNNTIIDNRAAMSGNLRRMNITYNNIFDNEVKLGLVYEREDGIDLSYNWWGSAIERLIAENVNIENNIYPYLTEFNTFAPAVPEKQTPTPTPIITTTPTPTSTVAPTQSSSPTISAEPTATTQPTTSPTQTVSPKTTPTSSEPLGTRTGNDDIITIIIIISVVIALLCLIVFIKKKY